jgi:hypothetical protein
MIGVLDDPGFEFVGIPLPAHCGHSVSFFDVRVPEFSIIPSLFIRRLGPGII